MHRWVTLVMLLQESMTSGKINLLCLECDWIVQNYTFLSTDPWIPLLEYSIGCTLMCLILMNDARQFGSVPAWRPLSVPQGALTTIKLPPVSLRHLHPRTVSPIQLLHGKNLVWKQDHLFSAMALAPTDLGADCHSQNLWELVWPQVVSSCLDSCRGCRHL